MIPEQPLSLAVGADLSLEALLAIPDAPSAGVVICHPHPLYGGDMDNPVVVRVQEVCADLGVATLRFNFRGVGGSGGAHGDGVGEQDDGRRSRPSPGRQAERRARSPVIRSAPGSPRSSRAATLESGAWP